MNCPDCGTPMQEIDTPSEGGWPQIVYQCPACYPVNLAELRRRMKEIDDEPQEGTTMATVDTETARRLRRAAGHLERWHTERDELIRQAHAEGMGVREIARQVGMTHPGVLAILGRERESVGT